MLGLFLKDFYLIMANKKMYGVFAILAIGFASIGKGESAVMAVSYFTMVLGMSVLSTITYDEYDHSVVHLMTLPIKRRDYAIEKSLFSFVSLLISWIIGLTAITITLLVKGVEIEWNTWIVSNIGILLIMTLLVGIMIPIQIKVGGENGRLVVVGVILASFIVAFVISKLLVHLNVDFGAIFTSIERMLDEVHVVVALLLSLLVMAVVFTLSGLVSACVVRKKEY